MRSVLEGSKTWLQGSSIHVPDDWLTACIEWIQEENGGSQNQEQINSLVYEQWLLADLHDLETQCLPAELQTTAKYVLRGTYALQVDSILDVGKSYYSQQVKVKGTENSNAAVSADDPNQKPWEPKPTRMLLMKLTDGKHTVQGMEYRPIACLNPQTTPGTKIHVIGTVLCRHAVLMLSEQNIRVLGGEVDTLVEANTPLNVLQSAMEASTEFAGKCHKRQLAGSAVTYPMKGGSKCSVSTLQPNSRQQGAPRHSVEGINRGSMSQFRGGHAKQEVHSQKPAVALPIADEQWDDDAFLDEMDIDDIGHDILNAPQPTNQQPRPGTSNNRSNLQRAHIKTSMSQQQSVVDRHIPHGKANINYGVPNRNNLASLPTRQVTVGQGRTTQQTLGSNADEFPEFEDMDFEDFDVGNSHGSKNKGNSLNVPKTSVKTSNQITARDIPDMGDFVEGFDAASRTSSSLHNPALTGDNVETFDDMFDGDDDDFNDSFGEEKLTAVGPGSGKAFSNQRNLNASKNSVPSLTTKPTNSKPTVTSWNRQASYGDHITPQQQNIAPPVGNQQPVVIRNMNINITIGSNNPGHVQARHQQPTEVNQETSKSRVTPAPNVTSGPTQDNSDQDTSDRRKKPKLSLGKVKSEQRNTVQQSTNEEMMSGVNEEPAYNKIDSDSHYPYMYLTNVIKQPVMEQARIYTIKAYISTLTSKLTQVNNQWCLSCKINDGTMAIDVDLSGKMLTQLIGFSAEESQVMKQRAKTDRGVRNVLQEGIRQCQQKLVELYGLMELEISRAHPRPLVLVTRRIDGHHIQLLYNRVMSSWHRRPPHITAVQPSHELLASTATTYNCCTTES